MAKKELKAAKAAYKRAKKKPLGEGSRFKAMTRVVKAGGAKNPEAVSAMIGRRKYGAKKMAKWAAAGRKKK